MRRYNTTTITTDYTATTSKARLAPLARAEGGGRAANALLASAAEVPLPNTEGADAQVDY